MQKTFNIPLSALSINAVYCRNRSYKTANYKKWEASIFHKLDNEHYLEKFKELREYFDSNKHAIEVNLKFFYPKSILYTKKGSLSARAHDISNIEKPIIDLLFLPCYHNRPSPYGCKNLNIDDKYITKLTSQKIAANEHSIEAIIKIVNI